MWIRVHNDELLNFNNVFNIVLESYGGMNLIKAYSVSITSNEGYVEFFDTIVAEFKDKKQAQKYLDKLAEKLGAEEFKFDED